MPVCVLQTFFFGFIGRTELSAHVGCSPRTQNHPRSLKNDGFWLKRRSLQISRIFKDFGFWCQLELLETLSTLQIISERLGSGTHAQLPAPASVPYALIETNC